MKKQTDFPSALRHRVFLTLLAGTGSLLITGITFASTKDHVLLCLGTIIFLCCTGKGILLWHTLFRDNYVTITGTCTAISRLPLHGYQKILVMQEDGTETTLILNRQTQLKANTPYHFYFRQGSGLISGAFLGCEVSESQPTEIL